MHSYSRHRLYVLPNYWTDLHIKSLNVRFEQQSSMTSPAPEPDHASMPPLAAAKKLCAELSTRPRREGPPLKASHIRFLHGHALQSQNHGRPQPALRHQVIRNPGEDIVFAGVGLQRIRRQRRPYQKPAQLRLGQTLSRGSRNRASGSIRGPRVSHLCVYFTPECLSGPSTA